MTVRWSMALMGLFSMTACATVEEIDALKATMNATINSNRRVLESRMNKVEKEMRQHDDQQGDIAELREAINRLSDSLRQTARETADLRESLHDQHGSVRVLLEAEEAFYRDRLRAVQTMKDGLIKSPYQTSGTATSLFPLDTLAR